MKPSRVCGTSPDLGCSVVSGSMCRVTSPVDPSCTEKRSDSGVRKGGPVSDVGVGVGPSELADGGGADTEVPIGLDTEVSVEDPPEERDASDLLSLSDSSIAFLKS